MLSHGTYVDDLLIPVLVLLGLAATAVRLNGVPELRPGDACPYCGAPSESGERCPRCGFRLERYAASHGGEGGAREG